MSSRLTRTLLVLYPRRVRNRYGQELLELEDELAAHGDRSRARLVRDMLAGALSVRAVGHRVRLVATAFSLIAAVGIGTVVIAENGAGTPPGASSAAPRLTAQAPSAPSRRRAPTAMSILPGMTCPVDTNSRCSTTACSEFVNQSSIQDVAQSIGTVAVVRRQRSATSTRCTALPHPKPPRPVFVGASS